MAEHTVTMTLESGVCNKGHLYALTKGVYGRCPYCLYDELNISKDIVHRLNHVITGLRGAIERMKK